MTDAELYTLIQSDSDAKQKADIGDDSGCAARLRKELAKLGKWGGLQRVANNFESPDPPYQQARTIIDLITAGDAVDLDEPAIAAGTPQLIQHNLLTLTDVAVISALANTQQVISPAQVSDAMRPYRGGV